MTDHCVYCKIIDNTINDITKLYEDDLVVAFLTNAPINKGHTIIATKQHFVNVASVNEFTCGRLFYIATRIGTAARRALDADGYNIFIADGFCAGQDIQHAHLHMIPRFIDDGFHWNWRMLKTLDKEQEIAEKIKSKLKVEL